MIIPPTMQNPFLKHVVGQEWMPPAGNIHDLHKTVFETVKEHLQGVRKADSGVSLVVRGEAGSGKTHLITQLRKEVLDDPGIFVIRVAMNDSMPGQLWRFIRKRFFTELMEKRWNTADPELTGLFRIVQNRFPEWSAKGNRSVLDKLLGSVPVSERLKQHLLEFASDHEFAHELKVVLPKLWDPNPEVADNARNWLKGTSLTDEELQSIGLSTRSGDDFEQEETARGIVLSLFRLAAGRTTLMICFDEIEAILLGNQDRYAMRSFTTLVTHLLSVPGPRLVITFLRPGTIQRLEAEVEHSNLQKIRQVSVDIPSISQWEHVVQLVLARLHSDPNCRAERTKNTANPYWPFSEQFLRQVHETNRLTLTPRELMLVCQVEFKRIQEGRPPERESRDQQPSGVDESEPVALVRVPSPIVFPTPPKSRVTPKPDTPSLPFAAETVASTAVTPPPLPPPPPLPLPICARQLRSIWQNRLAHFAKRPSSINFETVVGKGLPLLAESLNLPYTVSQEPDSRLGDVTMFFQPDSTEGKRIGIGLCHHELRLLWRRLDRLVNQAQAAKAHKLLDQLVLLRAEDDSLSDSAKERFEKLKRGGSKVCYLSKSQMIDLATLQDLFAKTATGEITNNGRPISLDDFRGWMKEEVPHSLKELADTIFDTTTAAATEAAKETAPAKEAVSPPPSPIPVEHPTPPPARNGSSQKLPTTMRAKVVFAEKKKATLPEAWPTKAPKKKG